MASGAVDGPTRTRLTHQGASDTQIGVVGGLGVVVGLGVEGWHGGGQHAVCLDVVSLDVRLVEVVITQVTREQSVPLRPVLDQQFVRGEVLFTLIATEYVVLVNVMLLLLSLCFKDFVAELAIQQGVD